MQRRIVLVLAVLLCFSALGGEEAWVQEFRKVSEQYKTELDSASTLAGSGKLLEANRQVIELADKVKSPYLDFYIGNNIYRMDPVASYAIHKRMYEAKPEIGNFMLEWGMERHRKGEYAEAAKLYEDVFKHETDARIKALLADCYIRTGKLKEAVQAWGEARHGSNHTAIDFAIFEIYGHLHPLRLRADLLEKIKAGGAGEIEQLIELDLNFEMDWWNTRTHEKFLAEDMKLAEKLLGTESIRFKELQLYVEHSERNGHDDAEKRKAPKELTVEKLKEMGLLLGEKGRLPASLLVADMLILKAIEQKWETRAELLKRFEPELAARAESKEGDPAALGVLICLTAENDAKLGKYMRIGWERYNNATMAMGTLNLLMEQKALKPDSAELAKALKQFPEDGPLIRTRMKVNGAGKATREDLVELIKAEYRSLSARMGMRDSYTLKGLFYLLGEELKGK